jgi:hypothetical protein
MFAIIIFTGRVPLTKIGFMPRLGKIITPTEIVRLRQTIYPFGIEYAGRFLRFSHFSFEKNGHQEIQTFLGYEKKSRLA